MLDITASKNCVDRANELVSLQAIQHCPDRRLELESMAPHLASMLEQTLKELCKMYRILNRRECSKAYIDLDKKVLAVVRKHDRVMLRQIIADIGPNYSCRQIEDSLSHLHDQDDVTYHRRGRRMGWSVT